MPTVVDSANLFFREGSSDKEYHAQIMEENGGYSVLFQYGRRGSSLTSGSKVTGVARPKAETVFNKLVNEKLSKGYQRAASGAAPSYSQTADNDLQTDLRPQLLNVINEEQLESCLNNDQFILQEKKDGKRIMIRKNDEGTVAINRKGKIVSIPQDILDEINRIPRSVTVDGELVGSIYYIFDILSWGGQQQLEDGYGRRLAVLLRVAANLNWGTGVPETATINVAIVPGFQGEAAKRTALRNLREVRAEGIVFKEVDSKVSPGRPNSGGPQLKYKFTQTCTCVVAARNGEKRSVSLQLQGMERSVGNVTIPANFEIPIPGMLIEVRYLYAYPGGSLYQPVYLGPRDDIDEADLYTSLKFKQGTDEEEDEG